MRFARFGKVHSPDPPVLKNFNGNMHHITYRNPTDLISSSTFWGNGCVTPEAGLSSGHRGTIGLIRLSWYKSRTANVYTSTDTGANMDSRFRFQWARDAAGYHAEYRKPGRRRYSVRDGGELTSYTPDDSVRPLHLQIAALT